MSRHPDTKRFRALWKAYPAGVLPMRGVSTIGGWTATDRPDGRMGVTFVSSLCDTQLILSDEGEPSVGAIEAGASRTMADGHLLPWLDPIAEPATWTCALIDLATASFGLGIVQARKQHAIRWRRWCGEWVVSLGSGDPRRLFPIERADPVDALLEARAILNSET